MNEIGKIKKKFFLLTKKKLQSNMNSVKMNEEAL
jgi:hypothetical protein